MTEGIKMSELQKLNKLMKKLEKKFETVAPMEKKRLMKRAQRTEARIKFLTKRG